MTAKPKTDREVVSTGNEFVWDTEENTEVHKFIVKPIIKQLTAHGAVDVLDLGCGNGSFSRQLEASGFRVTGLDHSLSGILIAQKYCTNATFSQHDITQPLPNSYHDKFDAVVSVEVIEHLLLPRHLIENAINSLKPGGVFILTTPYHGYWKNLALALTNKFDYHWHPLRDYGHVKFFSKSTILALFREFALQNIQFQSVGRIPIFARSMVISGTKP